MNEQWLNDEIAKEIEKEREEAELSEFAPPKVSNAQVNGAKYAWMIIAIVVDLATAYALWLILAPYWWYAVMWFTVAAGGLLFAEWLWERVGNNDKQIAISRVSKNVSALAVAGMAIITGVGLVSNIHLVGWIENLAVVSVLALMCFHGWQAYQYHEVDDDYVAQTLEARAEATNQKEIRTIHRAGRRIHAKKKVYVTGQHYQKSHGNAFVKEAGRSFAADAQRPPQQPKQGNPTHGGQTDK